jgi:hypothetical protein
MPNQKKWIIVDTVPRGFKRSQTINPGIEFVADTLNAPIVHWTDKININDFDIIGFNIYYPLHLLNVYPFLISHNITDKHRSVKLVAGGQGVSNLKCIDDTVFDEVFKGEFDGTIIDKNGFHRAPTLISQPLIKYNKAIIEVTRGCKYKCSFCEYGHVLGGNYREKDISLIKTQIDQVITKTHSINLFSMNLAGYSNIDELLSYCIYKKIHILNISSCLSDIKKLEPILPKMNCIRIGVESFDEQTRWKAGKHLSDSNLLNTLDWLLDKVGYIYMYLIFGLPNDNYDNWYKYLDTLSTLRIQKNTSKNIKFDFSITPFEPSVGTPFENEPQVNFKERILFRRAWVDAMTKNHFLSKTYPNAEKSPGRFGRGEISYKVLMSLKTGNPSILNAIKSSFPNGSAMSLSKSSCKKYLNMVNHGTSKQ